MGVQISARSKAVRELERIEPNHDQSIAGLKRNEQLVYDALVRSKTPLKAYDLLEMLQDQGLKAPMTIYRALEALTAKKCVRRIESLNAFIAVGFDRDPRALGFLICRECMQAKEIALDERQVAALFSPIEVSAGDVRIEAFSECHQVCGDQTQKR